MILSNGNTIFTDLFKVDTDGDGLIDGLEIRLKKRNYVYHCFEFEIVDGVNPLLLLYSLLILYYYCYLSPDQSPLQSPDQSPCKNNSGQIFCLTVVVQ